MKGYKLSSAAEQDLEDIFDFTQSEFGLNQAVHYLLGFEELFKKLVDNPNIGRHRSEFRQGLRSFTKEAHIVFYEVMNHYVWIARVLHGSRYLPIFFE